MSRTAKAVLLSILVYPGSGHFYLKRYKTAILIFCFSTLGLMYLVSMAIDRAHEISARIVSGELPLDYNLIYQQISKVPQGSEGFLVHLATLTFIASWVIGIVDTYRVATNKTRVTSA